MNIATIQSCPPHAGRRFSQRRADVHARAETRAGARGVQWLRLAALATLMTGAVSFAVATGAEPSPAPTGAAAETPAPSLTNTPPAGTGKANAEPNNSPQAPGDAAPQAGDLTPADQATVNAAIGRLKRELLAECMLTQAEKKGLEKKPAIVDKRRPARKDEPAVEPDKDKRLAAALELAEKNLAEKKGKLPANLTKQFRHGLGEETLIGLALVKAGVSPNHPLMLQIWDDLQKDRCNQTYLAGVGLMLVEAMLHPPGGEAWALAVNDKPKITQWVNRVAHELATTGHGGAWSYGGKAYRDHDHSNTQYAALGLKAAKLCGWESKGSAPATVWPPLLEHFLKAQEKKGPEVKLSVQTEKTGTGGVDYTSESWKKAAGQDYSYEAIAQARGWDYKTDERSQSGPPSASLNMTIAGLTAIILARSELRLSAVEKSKDTKRKANDPDADRAICDGMAWVQLHWPLNIIDGYGLYGIERLGVLGNLAILGGHHWYREIAPMLAGKVMTVDTVGTGMSSAACERAFYLLFLVRGTSSAYAGPTAAGAD
jgi:hypothetical protein